MERIISVILADDHEQVRIGIRKLLDLSPDIVVVGEAGDGVEALKLVGSLDPDVLVLDVEMPRMNGPQVAEQLKSNGSRVNILALSAYDDEEYIHWMFESGAKGYLTKDEAPEALIKAVRCLYRGDQRWVSQRVADIVDSTHARQNPGKVKFSSRERDVLQLVAAKKSDEEIADLLDTTEKIISRHIERLCDKLGANTRAELSSLGKKTGHN